MQWNNESILILLTFIPFGGQAKAGKKEELTACLQRLRGVDYNIASEIADIQVCICSLNIYKYQTIFCVVNNGFLCATSITLCICRRLWKLQVRYQVSSWLIWSSPNCFAHLLWVTLSIVAYRELLHIPWLTSFCLYPTVYLVSWVIGVNCGLVLLSHYLLSCAL